MNAARNSTYICRKGLYDVFGVIWRIDIFGAVEEWFCEFELCIDVLCQSVMFEQFILGMNMNYLWNEKVDSATKVLNPAYCVHDSGGGGEEDEGVEAGGYEMGLVYCQMLEEDNKDFSTHNLLRNHTTHTDSNDVEFSFISPSKVVDDFNNILCHFRRRIAHRGFIRLAHAAVVEDEDGIFVGFLVTKVFCLSLP